MPSRERRVHHGAEAGRLAGPGAAGNEVVDRSNRELRKVGKDVEPPLGGVRGSALMGARSGLRCT